MPAGLPYFTIPFSGDFLDDADALLPERIAQHAADLHPLAHAAFRSPRPLSAMPISTSRVNVRLFATAHATAWHSRSTRAWS
jgi:hypothetical protein